LSVASTRDETEVRLTNAQEMRTQATNEPFQEDLENGSGDYGVEQTNNLIPSQLVFYWARFGTTYCIIQVPETTYSNLNDKEDRKRYQYRQKSSGPNGDDFLSKRICKFRIDNFSISEGNRERPSWCGVSKVDLK
jgi:hypothetical protein